MNLKKDSILGWPSPQTIHTFYLWSVVDSESGKTGLEYRKSDRMSRGDRSLDSCMPGYCSDLTCVVGRFQLYKQVDCFVGWTCDWRLQRE